jgi:hypothetical protein
LGLFDLIALGPEGVRAVQVKCGSARLTLTEAIIQSLKLHPVVLREYWRFPDYCRQPLIEAL